MEADSEMLKYIPIFGTLKLLFEHFDEISLKMLGILAAAICDYFIFYPDLFAIGYLSSEIVTAAFFIIRFGLIFYLKPGKKDFNIEPKFQPILDQKTESKIEHPEVEFESKAYVINPKVLKFYTMVFDEFCKTSLNKKIQFDRNSDAYKSLHLPLGDVSIEKNITVKMIGNPEDQIDFTGYENKVQKLIQMGVEFLQYFTNHTEECDKGHGYPKSHEISKVIHEIIESKCFVNQKAYRNWLKNCSEDSEDQIAGQKVDTFLKSKFAVTEMFNKFEIIMRIWLREIKNLS